MATTTDDLLLKAVRQKDLTAVQRLLARGGDPHVRDPQTGLTLLMIAAGYSAPELVRVLLAQGADPRSVDSRAGATALHKACQGGNLECARLLVQAGSFVDAQCVTTGHTPLVEAIWFKHPRIVQLLLDHGAGLKIDTHYGFTLRQHIDYALRVNLIGRDLVVDANEAVLARGSRDLVKVEQQQLMAAVRAGEVERVRTLLQAGADVDARYPILNGFDDAHTPLLVACRDGHTEIAAELLKAGANVNAVEPTFGAVPLHKAVYNGHAEITSLLVHQPGVDLDFQGATNGYTPLLDAIWHGFDRCAATLIEAGARLELTGHDGKDALDLARDIFGDDHPISRSIEQRLPAEQSVKTPTL